ncbi:MAG: glycosyltransferase family 2 protein [Rhizomicrobium sp.]|jgi:succinoglycan biosynthesis protein ExoO
MSSAPEISVVMANYNGGPYLAAAIKSLQSQTFKDWELILVDDASQDDSIDVAERLGANDARIVVMRQPTNRGPASARNRAFKVARGQWIAVFDSDDMMLPHRLETLRDRARNDKASIVADNLLVFADNVQAARPFLTNDLSVTSRWITLADFIDSNRLYSRTPDLGYLKPFINAAMLRNAGITYDERLHIGEDYDFMARLLAFGPKLRLEPSALYLYRKHPQSTSHRIRKEDIIALLDADERLVCGMSIVDGPVRLAIRRRKQSLESMLLYDRVVILIKTGHYAQATALGVGAPRVWPLLTRPVRALWNRLRARGHSSKQAVHEMSQRRQ